MKWPSHNKVQASSLKLEVLDPQYVAPFCNHNVSNGTGVKKLRPNLALCDHVKFSTELAKCLSKFYEYSLQSRCTVDRASLSRLGD